VFRSSARWRAEDLCVLVGSDWTGHAESGKEVWHNAEGEGHFYS